MMNQLFLTDKEVKENLFPFTLTRSAADIRVGILTIRGKWEALLSKKIKLTEEENDIPTNSFILASNIIPSRRFVQSLMADDGAFTHIPDRDDVKIIQYPWDIYAVNDWAIREDYEVITTGRKSQPLPASVQAIDAGNIFIEEGARLSHCVINASGGPVYIGRHAEIMEGSMIRGPVAICEGATVKMGARIYGATTIGPYSVAGGEIKNAVMFGYSNKGHDG
ncbi:MAG: putative sugar nucleotidyl transferase, partial [Flavitalea sp.]